MEQINTDQSANNDAKDFKSILKELTDEWLSNDDDSSFAVLVATCQKLNELKEEWLKDQKYLKLSTLVVFILESVSKKHLKPKEKQQTKEKLKEIIRIWNDSKASKAEKEQAVAEISDKIVDTLHVLLEEILVLVKDTQG